ncbi:MAG: HAMP domain-containing sensor histidine kinase [Phycisphaerae bacterium]|nr:HAMP domain-containing sensor histidine kinase [Phycisphaerae bacterium]
MAEDSTTNPTPPAPGVAATYVLPLPETSAGPLPTEPTAALPDFLLVQNILWFCRLRWFVVAFLLAFGLLGWLPRVAERLGLQRPGLWPFAAAGVLLVGNVLFLASARVLARSESPRRARLNLWFQIVLDVLVLTAVVHFVGSLSTYALFAYLFHTVLACIFFSRRQSLAVTELTIGLYVLCVTAERSGLIQSTSILAGGPANAGMRAVLTLNFLLALGIWMVVWYLSSHLAAMVRHREADLAATNRRLEAAQVERSRHMLTTTHQLKAPFAAIDANVQLLLNGMCGPLSPEAKDVAERIAARCRRLAREIQEMLQLANLNSAAQRPPDTTRLDLAEVLGWCIRQVEPLAQQHGVAIDEELQPATVTAADDHLRMMLTNLLSNAIVYSRPGGRVSVRCGRGADGEATVAVVDEGIGIAPEKLPRIFEEHYRTKEAVQHNKESSGLGLAIVRDVAELYRIQLTVTSRLNAGTTFQLAFAADRLNEDPKAKEK